MATMKMTLIGIENYLNYSNDSLFTDILLPDGIEKDILVNNLLKDSGEFEVLYSNVDFLKGLIELFFKTNYRTFNKWVTALNIEYNPLENYDRMEDWTDTGKQNINSSDKSKANSTGNTTGNDSSNTTGNNTINNTISAFDSSTLQPHDATNQNNSSNSTSNQNVNTKNDTTGESTHTEDNSNSNKRVGRAHGNIGVTTSQQMLESELDISLWNIYKHISDLFISEFCILVY